MSEEKKFEKQGVISAKTQKWLAEKKAKASGKTTKPEPKPKKEVSEHIKYSDGRRNNGALKGVSRGQGRKPKAKEEEIKNFALGSMKRAFGREKKAWEALANMSKDSFPHLRLLWEYKYGKPKEQKDLNIKQEVNIPVVSFLQPEQTIDIEAEIEENAKEDNEEGQSQS